jgi:hypothetical protein
MPIQITILVRHSEGWTGQARPETAPEAGHGSGR